MKFNCDRRREARRERRRRKVEAEMQWRRVFAVLPVRLKPGDCRWMEYVESRLVLDEPFPWYADQCAAVRTMFGSAHREYRSVNR